MNNWQERDKTLRLRNASCSVLGSTAALVKLSSLWLCLFILVLNVEVELAQDQPSELEKTDQAASRFRIERIKLDKERQLAYHTRFLRQVARSTALIEVSWKMEKILPSLRYIAENGTAKDKEAAKAVGSIFSRTEDVQARALCLSALKRIGNREAMREMLRICRDANSRDEWRTVCAEYLRIEPAQRPKAVGMSVRSQLNVSQRP